MAQSGDARLYRHSGFRYVDGSQSGGSETPADRVLLSQVPKPFMLFMDLTLKPVKEEKERLENTCDSTSYSETGQPFMKMLFV